MLTRQEREQIVLDLYNQGKTIRDIAKEVRISFRDIDAVLRRERKQLDNKTTSTDSDNNQDVCPYRLKLMNYFPKLKLQ
jgi:DNA-binding NarL/FixJ family response regulator